MYNDVRKTAAYADVEKHLRLAHEPAFGRPHAVDDPHVTADGARILVTGSVFDELAGTPRTALYSVENGELRPLTTGGDSCRSGRFSPDGRKLAYVRLGSAGRRGSHLCLLDTGDLGGAARAVHVPGTPELIAWSPDNRQVLLLVAGQGAVQSAAGGSGRNTAVDAADQVPHWHPSVDSGESAGGWRDLWLYEVDRDEMSRLTPAGVNVWEAAWCGTSAIVAITSAGPREDDWYDSSLVLIDVSTGAQRPLSSADPTGTHTMLGLPAGSPDGGHVAFVHGVCSDRGLIAGELAVIDLATGDHSTIDTQATDVTHVQWIDATRLGYVGLRHLDSVAGIVDTGSRKTSEIYSTTSSWGRLYPSGAFTADGRVVVTQNSYAIPSQVAMVGGDTDIVLASTAHGGSDYVRSIAGSARQISWPAPDGLVIEGMLCVPEGAGPFPLIVHIHGGPVWAFRNTWPLNHPWIPLLVSRGYAVLSPNPRGSAGRGRDFAQRVAGDMGGGDARDVVAGVDALIEQGIADPTRMALIGASYGGFLTSWLVTQDQRFAAAVPIAPITNWYSKCFTSNTAAFSRNYLRADPEQPGTMFHSRSPVLQASKVRTPCLNVAGVHDLCTPPGQSQEFHQALQTHGVESVLVVYPEEGHGVRSYPAMTDFMTRILLWFERHLSTE